MIDRHVPSSIALVTHQTTIATMTTKKRITNVMAINTFEFPSPHLKFPFRPQSSTSSALASKPKQEQEEQLYVYRYMCHF